MAKEAHQWEVKDDFSLEKLSKGICRVIEEENLYTYMEYVTDGSYIISATNVNDKGSGISRGITGTVRSISVYLRLDHNILSVYFENRAWEDKACGFILSTIFKPLFFSAAYGGIRQIELENNIYDYIDDVVNQNVLEDLRDMSFKKRILVATPLISLIIFLVMGFVFNMWGWGCLAFLLIPVMPMLLGELNYEYIYPIVVCGLYAGLGFGFGWWHPGWIVFLTIPVYYILFPFKDKPLRK